jgi:hypothetical protein
MEIGRVSWSQDPGKNKITLDIIGSGDLTIYLPPLIFLSHEKVSVTPPTYLSSTDGHQGRGWGASLVGQDTQRKA